MTYSKQIIEETLVKRPFTEGWLGLRTPRRGSIVLGTSSVQKGPPC